MRVRAAIATAAALLLAAAPAAAETIWAVGDGGVEGREDDDLAAYVQTQPIDRLLYLGDVYETGTAEEFATNYHSAWGRFKAITSPAPGNHEWDNRAEGYDPYWGARAPRDAGGHWYSFDAGGWHFVSLNSEDPAQLEPGSAQLRWLEADLAARPGTCTTAFFHRPRYNAGGHSDAEELEPLWRTLAGRARLVLSGHSHNYQRFRPNRGITQIVVGTGGRLPFHSVDPAYPGLAFGDSTTLGALRIEFTPGRAAFAQVAPGGRIVDSGEVGCSPTSGPRVTIGSPRHRAAYSRRVRRVRGTAAGADRVRLTLVRSRSGRCRVYVGRPRLRRASCATRRHVRVRVANGRWAHRLRTLLRPGRYVVTARVRDARGRTAADRSKFRIR